MARFPISSLPVLFKVKMWKREKFNVKTLKTSCQVVIRIGNVLDYTFDYIERVMCLIVS